MGVQLGARLTRSPPLPVEEFLWVESHLSCQHVIDRTAQLLGQYSSGLAVAIFFLQASEVFLGCWMVPEKQDSGFREGPFEIRVADLGP